jgi:hypothetical protein
MPPLKREYTSFMERVAETTPAKPIDPLLAQAAVKATLLVGDSKWDTFLSQLQAARELDVRQATDWTNKLKRAVGHDVVLCQMNIAIHEARIQLLDEVMLLPSELVRAAHAQS